MAKFCANLNFMFNEVPFLERYAAAKKCGFAAVETGFPFGFSLDEVVRAKRAADVKQVLINTYTGDVSKREMGFAAVPGKEKDFRDSIDKTIEFAKALNVEKIHVMSGIVERETPENFTCYVSNLKYAAKALEANSLLGVIEPINKYAVPNYYMNCYNKAIQALESVNSEHIKIMLDVFHMQHIQGNISKSITSLLPKIGHVQIAQVPNRNEPDTEGELNYRYILKHLKEAGYNDWIGLEYQPISTSEGGIKWIHNFGYTL